MKKRLVTNKGHNYNQPINAKPNTKKEIISSPPKRKGGEKIRPKDTIHSTEQALEETKKKATNGPESKSKDTLKEEVVKYCTLAQLDLFQTNTQKQMDDLYNELEEHKKAIKFLLSTNKHFQNEIQKKEFNRQEKK